MAIARRLNRIRAHTVPRRRILVGALAIAAVPALATGLLALSGPLVAGVRLRDALTPSAALLLVATVLATLLLVVSATGLWVRGQRMRALHEAARRADRRLSAVIGATDDAIVLLDAAGSIRGWNPSAERLYGIPAREALGREFDAFVAPPDGPATRDALALVVAADGRVTTRGSHIGADGAFTAVATWTAVRDDAGEVDSASVLIRDASQLDRAEAEARLTVDRLASSERRLRLLTDSAPDAVVSTDPDGRIVGWNLAAERLFGITERQAMALRLADVLVALDGEQPVDARAWLARAGAATRADGRRADGSTFAAEVSMSTFEDAGHAWFTTFVRDVTERLVTQERAREHESRYRALVEHLPGVVYRAMVGRWAPTTYISPQVQALLGYAPEDWIGVAGIWEEHIHPADLQRVLNEDDAEAAAGAGNAASEDREYRMLTHDRTEIWVRDHAVLERGADGSPIAWNGYLTDITERKQLESQLVHLAFHDPLTGLANRALLNDRVAHAIARRQRELGSIAMLVVDLDDFKLVNDTHGHDAGDRLIVAAAERLRECVRADATIARLGGDEFAILLEGLSDDAAALVVAQRTVRAFDAPLRLEGATIATRVSVGVAIDSTGRRSASWLMRSADTAMYEAKRLGKGRWQAYDPAAHLASAKRLVFEGELRRAVERRQFALVYQPVTNLRTGEVVGSEALIRWNHPTRGLIGPTEFISALESTGLIDPVGRWVVQEACRQAAAWAIQLPGLRWTAVNVSPAQLGSDEFLDCVADALRTHRLEPSRLTFEVTETLALDDSTDTVARLHRLRELGCRIAVDDFGTGYSSLAYLRRLPIDRIKIDRTFVDGLGTDPDATAVARAIVDLARGLHLGTVAEGIEHRRQAEALVELGCELGQGYLYARPLDAADLTSLVAGRQASAALRQARPATEVA